MEEKQRNNWFSSWILYQSGEGKRYIAINGAVPVLALTTYMLVRLLH